MPQHSPKSDRERKRSWKVNLMLCHYFTFSGSVQRVDTLNAAVKEGDESGFCGQKKTTKEDDIDIEDDHPC